MHHYLIYQAYGSQEIIDECVLSIYSLLYHYHRLPQLKIIIYTDNEAAFRAHLAPLEELLIYQRLTPQSIIEWKGPHAFVHRVKVELLRDWCSKLTEPTAILYLDTDTWFKRAPLPLFRAIEQGRKVVHIAEGRIEDRSNPIFKKLNKLVKRGGVAGVTPGVTMYNAGVLGFTNDACTLLDEVLVTTDVLYAALPKHVMEQLAFSYHFSLQEAPLEAAGYIGHYWNGKAIRTQIAEWLERAKNPDDAFSYKDAVDLLEPALKKLNKPKKENMANLFLLANRRV